MTLVESRAENLVHPVGTVGSHPGVLGSIPTHGKGEAGIGIGELAHLNFLLGIQGPDNVGSGADTGYQVVLDVDTLVGLLGGHEDNTAGTGGSTVDSCGSSILQDDDAFDVIHGSDGSTGNAVYHPQHRLTVGVTGTLTTDDNVGRSIRRATIGGNGHTGDLALEHAFGRSNRTGSQFIGIVHNTDGSGQVLLLGLGTVTQGYGFLKHFSIFHEDDVDGSTSVDVHLLGGVTQAGNLEDCVGRNRDGISTIQVRDGVGIAGEHHGTHDGSHGVTHGTTHCQILGIGANTAQQKCHHSAKNSEHTKQFVGLHS